MAGDFAPYNPHQWLLALGTSAGSDLPPAPPAKGVTFPLRTSHQALHPGPV